MSVCERVAARFAATRRIEHRFGTPMLLRLGLTLTAMPLEASYRDREAAQVYEGGAPCEVRPAPLTAPSEGKEQMHVTAGRDHCERDQEMLTKPDATVLPLVASGAAHEEALSRR